MDSTNDHASVMRLDAKGRSHVVLANCYDYPQYYDIALQAHTQLEADFIEAACRKYCPFVTRRLLEPACGTGRLITALASRGYQVAGFDLNQSALSYLRRRLARRGLCANTFEADMSDFSLDRAVDAAYCTVNTFRHLLTEGTAREHLQCIADSLRLGGIYILGLSVLSPGMNEEDARHWTQRRGDTKVTVTLRALRTDLRHRVERLQVHMLVLRRSEELHLRYEFQFRT